VAELIEELLDRCRKGDPYASQVVVKRFWPKALDLAKALIGDRHLAEDAVQDAFLVAFSRLDQLRNPSAFPGWLRQIVRSQALKTIRQAGKHRLQDIEPPGNPVLPDAIAEQKELQQIVRQALTELSAVNRQTAQLYYLHEHSCTDIANALNTPAGTIKRRLYESRQKLKNNLHNYATDSGTKRINDKEIPL
jgi:RNA polymerase sigma factor (sigma-70 family)